MPAEITLLDYVVLIVPICAVLVLSLLGARKRG